jgi:hypothetical protein
MPLPRLALILIVLILAGESAVAVWRHLPVEPSSARVFSFPPAAQNFSKPGKLATAIEWYGADRGAEWQAAATDGSRLAIIYLEWDRVKTGPFIRELAGHAPEACNVAAGFDLNAILPARTYEIPGEPPLVFDATHLTDPSGRSVYIFKIPWFQGIGSLPLYRSYDRKKRLQDSLRRRIGAARMLQAGVFDAHDADHAWQIFRTEVLDQLKWTP